MKKIKRFFIIFIFLCLYIYISAISYVKVVSNDLQQSIFRLHVIANSDSIEDQNLKFKVRDKIIEHMNSLCSNTKSKSEAIQIAKEHSDEFYDIAKKTLEENGYSYDVKLNFGNYNFPTKKYGDIIFPSGNYDALKIDSGIVPDESKDILKDSLSNDEEYILINEEKSSNIKLKFKLIEMFQNVKIKTAKK